MENETQDRLIYFDMGALKNNLPQKRGLSRYYSGKARSFTCMADIRCVEDLKKKDHLDAKRRKKYAERREMPIPPHPCRRASSTTHFSALCIGV